MTLARIGTELLSVTRWAAPWLSMAALLTIAGCMDSSDAAPDSGFDRGHGDAAVADAGMAGDAAPASPDPEAGERCYDGVDNDEDGRVDCADESCLVEAACCVDNGAPACCADPGDDVTLAIDCTEGLVDECAVSDAPLTFFGAVRPTVEGGALVPQGGAGYGGVVVGRALDARAANIAFEADIEVPASRCAECVDGAGLAIFDALPVDGERSVVRFGVLVSGSRDEVLVLAFDEPIARAPIRMGSARYRLELDVGGHARVLVDGVELAAVRALELPSDAHLAIFGRTANRGPGVDAVRVRGAEVTTSVCDIPAALGRASAPVVPWSGSTWTPREVRGPSLLARGDGDALLAFEHEGQIHLAGRTGGGEFRNPSFDPGPPAFALPASLVAARDPWLVSDGADLLLYFTGVAADGSASIWRTRGEGALPSFDPPTEALAPAPFALDGLDGPSVLVEAERWTMVARGTLDGRSRLLRFTSTDGGASWALHGGDLERATLRAPRADDLFAFDRDEVAAPALVRFPNAQGRDVLRLYYAGRRGTGWSVGMLATSDDHNWRPIGPVLTPGASFDMLGVTDPAPLVEDGVLRLYYAGTDGSGYRIGVSGPAGTVGE